MRRALPMLGDITGLLLAPQSFLRLNQRTFKSPSSKSAGLFNVRLLAGSGELQAPP
jgi:hypothetical protein